MVRCVIPWPAAQIPLVLLDGFLRGNGRQLRAPLVVTVKARPADPAYPFLAIAVGIIRDHHAGVQAGARGEKVVQDNITGPSTSRSRRHVFLFRLASAFLDARNPWPG